MFALSVGLVITGLIIRFTIKIQTLAWTFAGFLMPLSCVFYPITALPGWLRPVAVILPTTHAFEGMRQLIEHDTFSLRHCGYGVSLSLAYFCAALIFFIGCSTSPVRKAFWRNRNSASISGGPPQGQLQIGGIVGGQPSERLIPESALARLFCVLLSRNENRYHPQRTRLRRVRHPITDSPPVSAGDFFEVRGADASCYLPLPNIGCFGGRL
jgi:hypothetical protein